VKGTLHWVSAAHAVPCEVRLYDRLFTHPDPEAGPDADFRTRLNPESLVVIERAFVEPSVAGAEAGALYQFERLGYFSADIVDSRPDALVFNRIVTLRDTWAKVAPGGTPHKSDGRPDRTAASKRTPARTDAQSAAKVRTAGPRDAQLEGRRRRLASEMGVPAEQAEVLTRDAAIADFFDAAVAAGATPRTVAKLLVNDMPREAREHAGALPIGGAAVGALAHMIDASEISSSAARDVLAQMIEHGGDPGVIVEERGLRQVSDEAALRRTVEDVLRENAGKVDEYRAGKTGLLGFFIGQAMAKTRGQGNPAMLKTMVEEMLQT
jgi:glutaminyl-tRNA synthetase